MVKFTLKAPSGVTKTFNTEKELAEYLKYNRWGKIEYKLIVEYIQTNEDRLDSIVDMANAIQKHVLELRNEKDVDKNYNTIVILSQKMANNALKIKKSNEHTV